MALPVSFLGYTLNDNTIGRNGQPETGSFRVPILTLTAANLTATQTLITDFAVAVAAVSNGVVRHQTTILEETAGSPTPAPSTLDQRENKYLVRYHDVINGQKFRFSIPVADLAILPNNREFLPTDVGAGADLKAAAEALMRSPNDGSHAIVVDSIQYVGANS